MGVREVVLGALAAVAVAPALGATPAFAASGGSETLIVGLKAADRRAPAGAEELPGTGAVTVEVPTGRVAEAARKLAADPGVAYVEPDHVAHADAITPNDPGYRGQWGTVQTRVNQAWSSVRGSSRVVIAVVDTGVTATKDLAGRVLPGHDFVNDDDDPRDDSGHGTMAAEVAAANGYNRIGIAGVCWACRILPVKVLGKDGSGSYSDIAQGIRYAADRGAKVINLSLSGTDDSQLLRDAVTYATGKGSLVLAAAGNDGSSAPHFPAAIPAVVAVGGATSTGTRYPWSDYGSWVDLTAPGCNPSQALNGTIAQFCGTSSAAPFTAGVAGLLASTDPAPSTAAVRAALVASRVGSIRRVDALRALDALPYAGDRTAPAIVFVKTPKLSRGVVTASVAASDQHGIAGVRFYAAGRLVSIDVSVPYTFSWKANTKGLVAIQARAYDRAGNAAGTARGVRI
jgi:subtilisin family serine protease